MSKKIRIDRSVSIEKLFKKVRKMYDANFDGMNYSILSTSTGALLSDLKKFGIKAKMDDICAVLNMLIDKKIAKITSVGTSNEQKIYVRFDYNRKRSSKLK